MAISNNDPIVSDRIQTGCERAVLVTSNTWWKTVPDQQPPSTRLHNIIADFIKSKPHASIDLMALEASRLALQTCERLVKPDTLTIFQLRIGDVIGRALGSPRMNRTFRFSGRSFETTESAWMLWMGPWCGYFLVTVIYRVTLAAGWAPHDGKAYSEKTLYGPWTLWASSLTKLGRLIRMRIMCVFIPYHWLKAL